MVNSYDVQGFYVDCDTALCTDCYDRLGFPYVWEGFEGWEEPLAIFPDTESDTPTHCAECKGLIPHALTHDGYEYVRAAILERATLRSVDYGLRTGDGTAQVCLATMVDECAIKLACGRHVEEGHDLAAAALLRVEDIWCDSRYWADGWLDDPDMSEALYEAQQQAESNLWGGLYAMSNGDAGMWWLLDMSLLSDVEREWADHYEEWAD